MLQEALKIAKINDMESVCEERVSIGGVYEWGANAHSAGWRAQRQCWAERGERAGRRERRESWAERGERV